MGLSIAAVAAVLVTGCWGASRSRDAAPPDAGTRAKLLASTQPAAPAAVAAALSAIPDGRWSRGRVAYVDVGRLREIDGVPAAAVLERVLGPGARRVRALAAGAAPTAVQLGAALTLLDGVAVAADPALAARLARPAADTVITPSAQSAVQSCLGDTVAQTFLGPGNMGTDAAIGAGLAMSRDAPAGPQLRICGAPHYRRHIHETERRLQRLLRPAGDAAVIGEYEIGEREIVRAIVAVDDLPRSTLLGLLGGERQLRAVAWR